MQVDRNGFIFLHGQHIAESEMSVAPHQWNAGSRTYSMPSISNGSHSEIAGRRKKSSENTSVFSILSAVEAAFMIDYYQRNYKSRKDKLSLKFRVLYENLKGERPRLEDILETWKQVVSIESPQLIGDIKGAFQLSTLVGARTLLGTQPGEKV